LWQNRWNELSKEEKRAYKERAAAQKTSTEKTSHEMPKATAAARPKMKVKKICTKTTSSKVQRWRRRKAITRAASLGKTTANELADDMVASLKKLQGDCPDIMSVVWQKLSSELGKDTTTSMESLTSCARFFLSKLNNAPGFAVPNPPSNVLAVRRYVDSLVREYCGTQKSASDFGYPLGRVRWDGGAAGATSAPAKRGRPNKIDNPEVIAKVEAAFAASSQPSSRLCWDHKSEQWMLVPCHAESIIFCFLGANLVPQFICSKLLCKGLCASQVNTLLEDKKSVFLQQPDLQADLSLRSLHRLARKHLRRFKGADSINDYCIYCWDLKNKVMPQLSELHSSLRTDLESFMASYFTQWDQYMMGTDLAERPGLHLRDLRHYIDHHSSRDPCRKHRNQDAVNRFPCGLLQVRSRQSDFPQRWRVSLHAKEAEISLKCQQMSKLLDSYLFHRSANQLQKPLLQKLLDEPPAGSLVLERF